MILTQPIEYIDFDDDGVPEKIDLDLTFTDEYPMAINLIYTPYVTSSENPNEQVDVNYVPVTSEYITSDELWQVSEDNFLSNIWNKNQSVCKWGYSNSINTYDYPYRYGHDLDVNGLFNQSPTVGQNGFPYAIRKFRDLDYFYRMGIENSFTSTYENYTLHVKENTFNVDQYLSSEFDYFDYIFNTDILTTDGLILTKKYSTFWFW